MAETGEARNTQYFFMKLFFNTVNQSFYHCTLKMCSWAHGRMRPSQANGLDSHCNALHLLVWGKSQLQALRSELLPTLNRIVRPSTGTLLVSEHAYRCFAEVWCFLWEAQATVSNQQRQWHISVFGQRNCNWWNVTCGHTRDNLTDLEGFSSSFWQWESKVNVLMLNSLALTAKQLS